MQRKKVEKFTSKGDVDYNEWIGTDKTLMDYLSFHYFQQDSSQGNLQHILCDVIICNGSPASDNFLKFLGAIEPYKINHAFETSVIVSI